jgi:hypothetical protein
MKNFLLEVKTSDLTSALKHLCRIEKLASRACLRYQDPILTISLGRTQQDIPASGSWPSVISVPRAWAETLSTKPHIVPVETLRVEDTFLWAGEFRCAFHEGCSQELDEDAENYQKRVAAAVRILERHRVSEQDIVALIGAADPEKAKLWSPDEERIIDEIGRVWANLVVYGVEPSDIRKMLHQKSSDLWKSRTQPR